MHTAILRAALFTPTSNGGWGLPLLLEGSPGAAKTSIIEELSASCGLECETLSPSERGEGAFGVVMVPAGQGADMVLRAPRPDWTEKFDATQRGVVFVDELTSTPPALQAPLMGLLLAKRIAGFKLPKGVRLLGACNPAEIAAGGFDLAAPVANRLGHLDWPNLSVAEHVSYMLRGGAEEREEPAVAEDEEARVLAAWGPAWAKAVGLETAFLTRRADLKNKVPAAHDPKASKAWPSDRTWEFATRAKASAEVHNLSASETSLFVEAFIGSAAAGEFFTFIEQQDLPDPVALLDGKTDFKHSSKRLDRTLAVLASCTALVTPQNAVKRKERANVLWDLMEKMTTDKADLDIFVPSSGALIDALLHTSGSAGKMLSRLQPVLRQANVTPGGRK